MMYRILRKLKDNGDEWFIVEKGKTRWWFFTTWDQVGEQFSSFNEARDFVVKGRIEVETVDEIQVESL